MKLTRKAFIDHCPFSGAELAFDSAFPSGECPGLRELALAFLSVRNPLATSWLMFTLAKVMPSAKIRRWMPDLPPRPNRRLRLCTHAWLWGAYGCATGKGFFFAPDDIHPGCAARIRCALDILEPVKPSLHKPTRKGSRK